MGKADVPGRIPSVREIMDDPRLRAAAAGLGRSEAREAARRVQRSLRGGHRPLAEAVADAVAALPPAPTRHRRVLNATGVLVHTNLGRAPLSRAAVDAVAYLAGTSDLELDLAQNRRGRRGRGALEALHAAVPAAEAVHVVNNNAAAMVLVATALAQGAEIVVSRGELVEIGDGFRLPELLESTGARLREVGTTNRTTADDYARAINDNTALLLRVHPSNFAMSGYVSSPSVRELAALGRPLVVDIGSGLLAPHPLLPDEPDAATVLAQGAALVTASGDKLLGGPQAGLLLGEAALVERLRRHPLARALRTGKLTLAALEATLRGPVPPLPAALSRSVGELGDRAGEMARRLCGAGLEAVAVATEAVVGGGGAPGVALPSAGVSLPDGLGPPLRAGRMPVLGCVHKGRLVLDLRTVEEEDDELLIGAVLDAWGLVARPSAASASVPASVSASASARAITATAGALKEPAGAVPETAKTVTHSAARAAGAVAEAVAGAGP
ncbi:L-seryl-tRNA(Sec) selenium transferase [Streptomyces uncialis]|uniref:L-seryl-tRNA(Sec) selenium transferase n=1 Tax=Streptomyces uncialis TaxID=1048205 RepID=UPI0037B63496